MITKIIDWPEIHDACWILVAELEKTGKNLEKLDGIIAIPRGGLVPAVILSHILESRLRRNIEVRTIYEDRVLGESFWYILLDEICDTGTTLDKEWISMCKQNRECITASLYLRYNSKFKPNIYGKIVEDNSWFNFPWET